MTRRHGEKNTYESIRFGKPSGLSVERDGIVEGAPKRTIHERSTYTPHRSLGKAKNDPRIGQNDQKAQQLVFIKPEAPDTERLLEDHRVIGHFLHHFDQTRCPNSALCDIRLPCEKHHDYPNRRP